MLELADTLDRSAPMIEAPEMIRREVGHLTLFREGYLAEWRGVRLHLTSREFEIVWLLAIRPGVVRRRNQLLEQADYDLDVADRNIDSAIKRIRIKFKAIDPDFAAIRTIYNVGYIWEP